jgi:REP element-mobilizing transposase RayT
MKLPPVRLRPQDRIIVHEAIDEHCQIRGWTLYAMNARTNHVHVVVAAHGAPQSIRDQLKANCTRRLRLAPDPLIREKTWTKGGDCELLDTDEDLEAAIRYVLECQ